jgi:hypothetical protein
MIDANLEPYAQSFFIKGMAEGELRGEQRGFLFYFEVIMKKNVPTGCNKPCCSDEEASG